MIGWSKDSLGLPSVALHYEITWPVGIPIVFQTQWQSLCTALTAGICLPLGLRKGTVKVSSAVQVRFPATFLEIADWESTPQRPQGMFTTIETWADQDLLSPMLLCMFNTDLPITYQTVCHTLTCGYSSVQTHSNNNVVGFETWAFKVCGHWTVTVVYVCRYAKVHI